MALETNDGIAYLMALKQATGSQPGAASAPAREQERMPETATTQNAEAFKAQRNAAAHVTNVKAAPRCARMGATFATWATFTDIGLNGCYVEAQATYPAGTLLHMKLEVNGIRFETKARVRISYPYLGMGIAFEDISEDDNTHLKRLLASLSRAAVIMGPGANSPYPSTGPMEGLLPVTSPEAALRVVIEFFEIHQVLVRDDFVKLLKKSQK